jgi:ribosomal protein L7/L12
MLNKNKKLQLTAYKGANNNTGLKSTIENMINAENSDTKIVKYIRKQTGLSLVEAKKLVEEIKKQNS